MIAAKIKTVVVLRSLARQSLHRRNCYFHSIWHCRVSAMDDRSCQKL